MRHPSGRHTTVIATTTPIGVAIRVDGNDVGMHRYGRLFVFLCVMCVYVRMFMMLCVLLFSCCVCQVPTKLHPWIYLTVFMLFLGPTLDMAFGLLWGIAAAYVPWLT